MIGRSDLQYLRGTPAEVLIERHASFCHGQFDPQGIPVVIAVRNEEADLPATLVALANSESPVLPIIAEGGSSDRTVEFGQAMGATVVPDLAEGKMRALQAGTNLALKEVPGEPVLSIDADTLVGQRWSSVMKNSLVNRTITEAPAVSCGLGVIRHGPKRRVDATRTTYIFGREAARTAMGKPPIARGWNMAVAFDEAGSMAKGFNALHPNLFLHQENAVRDLALGLGGQAIRVAHPDAWIVTRGDRYATIRQCVQVLMSNEARKEQYLEDYGSNIVQYDKSGAPPDEAV